MAHWELLPVLVTLICVSLWLAGCTLTNNSGLQSSPPMTTSADVATLTVQQRVAQVASPTTGFAVRVAVQPTLLPSPTPNIYLIEQNDTLLDIAITYDVSLELLRAANPSVDPRNLQIGQRIVIPPPEAVAEALLEDALRQPPAPLPLSAPACYPNTTQGVICLGALFNPLSDPVEQITLRVELLNAAGSAIGQQTVYLEQTYILPSQAAPYRASFANVNLNDVATISATLLTAATSNTLTNRFVPTVIESDSLTPQGRYAVIRATLHNTSEQPARPRVVAMLVDSGNQVYGYRVWEAIAVLAPNERLEIEIPILPVIQNAPPDLTYRLHVESRPAQ
ncbi:MAG: LysM peptidoglycan-binding domain-containing protein [Phototrophicaceae bacterium]|jgi:LysM repeat protein